MCKMSRSDAGKLGGLKMAARISEFWRNKYKNNPKACKYCNQELPFEKRKNKFCNHSCAASYTNSGTQRNVTDLKHAKKKCLFCEKDTCNPKFCTQECNVLYNWRNTVTEIESVGFIASRTVAKKYLSETYGNVCQICGISEWQGQPLVLVLDHINGNAEDWTLQNLRLICPNCDSQTPTFKGRNIGNGRHKRRERYRQGKSY